MDILDYLKIAVEKNTSDIFIAVGRKISFKINGVITPIGDEKLSSEMVETAVRTLYQMANREMERYLLTGDDDFSVSVPSLSRFRVSACRQRNSMAAVIRVVQYGIPDYAALHIPETVLSIADEKNGLVLVTGAAGCGKSTTLACILDNINKTRNSHIITLEDPIEFLHRDDKGLFMQREIPADSESYITALRASLRQVPDIIFLGEMRDNETIAAAMTAAETGHLVISTLHTSNAVNTLDRIIDVFPPTQQQQIRVQLSMALKAVVSQRLLPGRTGGLIPAFEIMRINSGIRNMIREGKTHQIDNVIQTSTTDGMISMDAYLLKLYEEGLITAETALENAANLTQMERKLGS
jgi:twitching motility protein PilT